MAGDVFNADATAHLCETPFLPEIFKLHPVIMTSILVMLLGRVFLKGFQKAIGLAVVLVLVYLSLNFVTIANAFHQISLKREVIQTWSQLLWKQHGSPLKMVMVFLLTSSFVTTVLIPIEEFKHGGEANGRALAYLDHKYFGDGFGTVYDLSTVSILWFAGASAMAGLLNIVPRYGMAPNWARASRPLVLVYTVIAIVVTILFRGDVDAQAGAYATGVLVLMSSAAFAVTLSTLRRRSVGSTLMFSMITLVFIYTTIVNIIERPDGVKIAAFFISSIVVASLISRVWRSTEIRAETIDLDENAQALIQQIGSRTIRLIAHRPRLGTEQEYADKEKEMREDNHIPIDDPVLFVEVRAKHPAL